MSARRFFLLCMQIELTLFGAPDCAPPADAIAHLDAYLSYQTGIGIGNPGMKKFSVTLYDGDTLFLQRELPPYFTEPLVYVFRNGRSLFVTSCPKNAEWAACAERRFRASTHEPADTAGYRLTAVCDVSVTVEKWRPSPDTPAKRRIAIPNLNSISWARMDSGKFRAALLTPAVNRTAHGISLDNLP